MRRGEARVERRLLLEESGGARELRRARRAVRRADEVRDCRLEDLHSGEEAGLLLLLGEELARPCEQRRAPRRVVLLHRARSFAQRLRRRVDIRRAQVDLARLLEERGGLRGVLGGVSSERRRRLHVLRRHERRVHVGVRLCRTGVCIHCLPQRLGDAKGARGLLEVGGGLVPVGLPPSKEAGLEALAAKRHLRVAFLFLPRLHR
mmetsp:Transcript_10646/g.26470  ORF Transcript_10646/g.26470 Transcript_10646/m.26470 type:complete len:205 (-) Transcript_10646:11-625(-)